MDNFVWSSFKLVLWTLVVVHALVTLLSWLLTIRTLGVSSLQQVTRMFYLSGNGWPVIVRVLLLCAPFAILRFLNSLGVGPGTFNIFPVNALLLMAIMLMSLPLIPPTAVVFSSSTDRQLRWALSLKKLAGGRRVISLLDTGYMNSRWNIRDLAATFIRHAITFMDVLRTMETENWRYVVQELIKFAPIVIVDTRVCTHALLFEASTVATNQYAHKAIFVSEDDGSCPVLERLVVNGSVRSDLLISIVKEDELGPILKRLVRSPRTLPQFGSFPAPPVPIGECVRGELQQESIVAGLTSDQGVAELVSTAEKNRLSTRWTLLLKLASLAFWVPFVMFLGFGPFIIEQAGPSRIPDLGLTGWLTLLSAGFVTSFISLPLIGSLRYVYVVSDYLLVSDDRGKEIMIHAFDIARVNGPDWTTLQRITIHLHRPSELGKKISFIPCLFKGSAIAADLRRLTSSQEPRQHSQQILRFPSISH